jgi:hypothetical protein
MSIKSNTEFVFHVINDPGSMIPERFSAHWIDEQNGIQGLYGRSIHAPESQTIVALLFMRKNGWNREKIDAWFAEHPEYIKPSVQKLGIQRESSGMIEGKMIKAKTRKNGLIADPADIVKMNLTSGVMCCVAGGMVSFEKSKEELEPKKKIPETLVERVKSRMGW